MAAENVQPAPLLNGCAIFGNCIILSVFSETTASMAISPSKRTPPLTTTVCGPIVWSILAAVNKSSSERIDCCVNNSASTKFGVTTVANGNNFCLIAVANFEALTESVSLNAITGSITTGTCPAYCLINCLTRSI